MNKVVMKLEVDNDKQKQKAMEAVCRLPGVDSLVVDMKARKMTLVGDADPAEVICKLRKSWHAELVSVGPAIQEKKDGKKKQGEKKDGGDQKTEGSKRKKIVDKKKTEAGQNAEAYKPYDPSLTQPYYFVPSAEENPNACVMC